MIIARKRTQIIRNSLAGCAVALIAFQAPSTAQEGGEEDQYRQLIIDYLKKGYDSAGKPDANFENDMADAGVDLVIGVADIGLMSAGVPGAGLVLGQLKSVLSGNSGSAAAANVINKRLDTMQQDITVLKGEVSQLYNKLAENGNTDRLSSLEPIMARFGEKVRRLDQARVMNKAEQEDYIGDIASIADSLLPENAAREDLWKWDNIHVVGKPGQGLGKDIETADEVRVMIDPYLSALALLAVAEKETGFYPTASFKEKHLYFLTGKGSALVTKKIGKPLIDRAFGPVRCSWRTPAGDSSVWTVTCSNRVASRTEEIDTQAPPGSPHVVPESMQATIDYLTAQVKAAENDYADVIAAAVKSLSDDFDGPAFGPATFSATDYLFAVDASGRLMKFRHEMREELDCKDPRFRSYPQCQKVVSIDACGRDAAPDANGSSVLSGVGGLRTKTTGFGSGVTQSANCIKKESADAGNLKLIHKLAAPVAEDGVWNGFTTIFQSEWVSSDLIVYGVNAAGDLLWRRIDALATATDGKATVKEAARPVGTGWNTLKNTFSTGEGVVYGVAANGDLVWYRHSNNRNGDAQAQWTSHSVGTGWGGFVRLFSPGDGVIYGVKPDGALLWYKHKGYLTGAGLGQAGSWEGPKQVGSGWASFRAIFAGPEGSIYAVNNEGELLYYRHLGWRDGTTQWTAPEKLADGWNAYSNMFAAMGGAAPVVK